MDSVIEILKKFQNSYDELQQKADELIIENKSFEAKIRELTYENQIYINKTTELQEHIKELEEEKKAFMKVSHVIFLENENAKLKNQLQEVSLKKIPVFYREKKIRNIIYYVSSKNDIYEKTENSLVGDLVGKLEKTPEGKTTVTWL
jgi:chromosome segregation ATPase